jgi:GH25 family lysozyme M1 (1,4-beta-N-acetylmuramidase)
MDKDVAVGTYAYFDKSAAGITDEWIEKQVNEFIQIYNVINKDGDWLVDIIPMLDFEFSGKEPVVRANTEQWQKFREAVLKWLELFEKKTWVTPGIYANASTYHDYFYRNPSFAKYPAWIACYSGDKIDQDRGIVTFHGDPMQADIIQFSEKIKKSGLWNSKWNVDGNTSTQWEFWKLIQNNGDTPKK